MDKYLKLDIIGKGCNGNSVMKVKNLEDNKIYALKQIFLDVENREENKKIMNEINILKNIRHQNIVEYFESFVHKSKFCIVMEWADGGDLSHIIKNKRSENKQIEEESIWIWFLQICQALKYIHSKKILHRDLKPQNIFITKKGQVKLGDFGISKILAGTMDYAKTSLGTPYFMSPEICSGNDYNFKTDIWMLGCVLYELSCLRKPFEGENFHKLLINILTKEISPIPKTYSTEMQIIINKLLLKDPELRPSIDEILSLDFISEILNQSNFNYYIKNDSSKTLIVNNYTSSSNLITINSSSTNFSSNTNNCTASPKQENDFNFHFFNLGFGNLLNEIDEVDEEHNTNSISMSPKHYNNFNLGYKKNGDFYQKKANIFSINSKTKQTSQSTGVNVIEKIVKNCSGNSDASKINAEKNEIRKQNLSNFSKQQTSNPQWQKNMHFKYFNERMSLEDKIRKVRERNKSINVSNYSKLHDTNVNINYANSILAPKSPHKVSSVVTKHNNNTKHNSNYSISSNKMFTNVNIPINTPVNNKFQMYKTMSNKTKRAKQFSMNITSIQSPEHKAVYFKENEKSGEFEEELPVPELKTNLNYLYQRMEGVNPKSDLKRFKLKYPKIQILIEQFGKEKANKLLSFINKLRNPIMILNKDDVIENIYGGNFRIVKNLLLEMFYNTNKENK